MARNCSKHHNLLKMCKHYFCWFNLYNGPPTNSVDTFRAMKPNELSKYERTKLYIDRMKLILKKKIPYHYYSGFWIQWIIWKHLKLYATYNFSNDRDQENAFIWIVSAFVLKLHDNCKYSARVWNKNTRWQEKVYKLKAE